MFGKGLQNKPASVPRQRHREFFPKIPLCSLTSIATIAAFHHFLHCYCTTCRPIVAFARHFVPATQFIEPLHLSSALSQLSSHSTQTTAQTQNTLLTTMPPKRPEKKQHHPTYAGMPGAGGAGRDSPIGEDDNEEVRHRPGRALSPCPSASPRNITLPTDIPPSMHFSRQNYPSPVR